MNVLPEAKRTDDPAVALVEALATHTTDDVCVLTVNLD
jgi:hypothetical protein